MTTDNLKLLGYNKLWLDYGVLTIDGLDKQVREFNTGEDQHTEHYRYRTFKNYIQSHLCLTQIEITQLLEIVKTETNYSVALSMGLDLLKSLQVASHMFKFVADNLINDFGTDIQKYIDKEVDRRRG